MGLGRSPDGRDGQWATIVTDTTQVLEGDDLLFKLEPSSIPPSLLNSLGILLQGQGVLTFWKMTLLSSSSSLAKAETPWCVLARGTSWF